MVRKSTDIRGTDDDKPMGIPVRRGCGGRIVATTIAFVLFVVAIVVIF